MREEKVPAVSLPRKTSIESYYSPRIGKGLPDYEVLGWESEQVQRARFDILLASVEMENKRILDVGCGLGNLLEYLNSKGMEVDYVGVDLLERMIECVKKKNLGGEFYCMNIFEAHSFDPGSFDIVYTSGIFNLNLGNNKEFLRKALGLFFELSTDTVVFNLLHHHSSDKEDKYYYFDPGEVQKIIREAYEGSLHTEIIENYLENDFTVVCKKK